MTWSVQFENVSKRYGRGGKRYASLRDDLASLGRRASRLLGRRPAEPQGFLALDRLSFEVAEGEAFALIGPNGAGKTTSLKLLTRISFPTEGRIRVRGRVAALIEVGSGIHPELTGRENIWLYGRIMGMTRPEIARRFGAIVEFAELGDVLDTPVKMYSSGMQLRLGFSIASHLDPDVFVVDEALAVGDQAFQTRCVERMMQLIREGRTLLFVSHNLPAVEAICPRGLFLLDGRIECIGETRDVLRRYLDWVETRQYRRLMLEVQRMDAGRAMAVRQQVDAERRKQEDAKKELQEQLTEYDELQMGEEIVLRVLEGDVDIKVGDNFFDKIRRAEIVIEDDIIKEIREP